METLLNRVFSKSTLDEVISTGKSDVLSAVTRNYHIKSGEATNISAFKKVYKYLDKHYRNEYYYKSQLLNKLLIGRHSLSTTSALRELPVGDSIADFILINGKAQVYEIKTGLDNLTRLSGQLSDYYQAFSFVNVITDDGHLEAVERMVQGKSAGILLLTKKNTIRKVKDPVEYVDELDSTVLFKILRKHEFELVIKNYYGELPIVNQFDYYQACLKLFNDIPIQTAYLMTVKCLKNRYLQLYEKQPARILDTPKELRELVYFANYNEKQIGQLKQSLAQTVFG